MIRFRYSDPCMLSGYSNKGDLRDENVFNGIPGATVGTGDFDACVAAIKTALLPATECSTPPCVFGGVSQPHLSDVGRPPSSRTVLFPR
jgi:hypothetical protein